MLANKIDSIFCVLSNSCYFMCAFSHYWLLVEKTRTRVCWGVADWSENSLIIYSVPGTAGGAEGQPEIRPSLQLILSPHLKKFTTKNKTFHTILTNQ